MAFDLVHKGAFIWGCSSKPHSQLDYPSGLTENLRYQLVKKCSCLSVLAQKAAIPVEDEKPLLHSPLDDNALLQYHNKGFHKDINMHPSELFYNIISSLIFIMFNYYLDHSSFDVLLIIDSLLYHH